jgi:hypothetical protein
VAEIVEAVVAVIAVEVHPEDRLVAVVTVVAEVALVAVVTAAAEAALVEEEVAAEVVPVPSVSGTKATVMPPTMKSQPRRETSRLETRPRSPHPKEANPLKLLRTEDKSRTFPT